MMITAPTAQEFCNITMLVNKEYKGYWHGSAFRKHPRGVFRDRLLFVNHWNTNCYCEVKVATDPAAKLIMGCQNPAAYGNPMPKVSSGELVTVYKDGQWVAEGPWCEKIVTILDALKLETEELQERKRQENTAKIEASKIAAKKRLDLAAAAWSQPLH